MPVVRKLSIFLFLANLICVPAHAAQVANYDFQDTLASSGPAAPSLVDLGTGSYVDDSVLGQACRVFEFAEQTGLSLDASGLLGGASYTFVATLSFADVSSWAKILDIHDRALDEGLYAEDNDLQFYDYSGLDLDQLSSDTWAQVALTFDGTTLQGYVNGVLAFSETDTDTVGAITSSTLYFFRDDTSTSDSENSSGRVANIQLYDEALSPAAIGALSFSCAGNGVAGAGGGAPAPVPTLSAYGLALTMLGLLLVAGRRLRALAKQ